MNVKRFVSLCDILFLMKTIFGARIKELRKEKRLSQLDLAKIFNVTMQTISAWENNIQETDFAMLITIAEYFNVSTDYLLGYGE